MKKTIPMILAAATALPFSANVLAEGPIDGKVYGKINLTVVSEKAKTGNTTTKDDSSMTSNASRFGFKGKTDLENDLKAIYQLEYEIAPHTGDAGGTGDEFKQRNSFVGIKSNFGTVIAGIHDTPLKLAQKKVDLFNDLHKADIKELVYGEERVKNAAMYTSPSFSGVKVAVMRQFHDESANGDAGTSASISYKQKGLYLALATDSKVDDATSNKDVTRVVAQYKIDNYTVGALFNQSQDSAKTKKEGSGYVLSGAYKMNNTTLKLQLGSSDEKGQVAVGSTAAAITTDQIAFGVDQKLGKQTKVFAYYSALDDDATSKKETTTMGLGIEHKF